MRKTVLILFVALATVFSSLAKSLYIGPVSITSDSREREYIYYLPSNYETKEPNVPLIILLHGLGQYNSDIDPVEVQALADRHHCIVLAPQALPEQDTQLLGLLSLAGDEFAPLAEALGTSAWGANAYVRINDLDTQTQAVIQFFAPTYYNAGKIQMNKDVNDCLFIWEAVQNLRNRLGGGSVIDQNKVFVVGCSLGGAMAYHYAFSSYSNAKKLVDVSGFVSKGVNIPSSYNLPTLVFHSKTDEIVPYYGGIYNRPVDEFVMENVMNNPHSSPKVTVINEDQPVEKQITVQDWKTAPEVVFYTVNQADHSMVDDMKALGVNIFKVIGNFLFDLPLPANEALADTNTLNIYPNPVEDIANVSIDGKYEIFNLAGVKVASGDTENGTIDMTSLIAGRYILMLTSGNDVYRSIIIKK